jgi:hypothetical protein
VSGDDRKYLEALAALFGGLIVFLILAICVSRFLEMP